MTKGHCLCGAIEWLADAALTGAAVCHCGQCRRQSGHVWASAMVPCGALTIIGTPTWFGASAAAQRGFCATCGSFLFWRAEGEDTISVSLGSIEAPTGVALEKHIFTSDKGDYYDIADNVPIES